MTETSFVPLDSENWEDFTEISVAEEQRDFVDTNLYVIAEAGIEGYETYGLYAGDDTAGTTAVGMAAFADLSDGVGMIHHVMVGEGAQGRGYGRALMEELLAMARRRGFRRVVLSYWPGNPAVSLYESLGFRHTGEKWGEEPVMAVDLSDEGT